MKLSDEEMARVKTDFAEISGVKSEVNSGCTFVFPRIMRGSIDRVKKYLNALPYVHTYMVSYTENDDIDFYSIVGTINFRKE